MTMEILENMVKAEIYSCSETEYWKAIGERDPSDIHKESHSSTKSKGQSLGVCSMISIEGSA